MDRLNVSYWLHGFGPSTMLREYEKMLLVFPFSKLRRTDSTFRIYVLEQSEPPMIEYPVGAPINVDGILAAAKEFQNADTCYELDAAWDLWTLEDEWKLGPSRVLLSCFGPEFDNDAGEHLRIDFGLDRQFLPEPGDLEGARIIKENIQSLLRLVHDLDNKLKVERRQLWSESGENFADRLQAALRGLDS
jgi:hypothetical protein